MKHMKLFQMRKREKIMICFDQALFDEIIETHSDDTHLQHDE